MDKILSFLKRKYKILIPVMVVFVLLITVYFFYREYKYDNYRNKQEVEVYQHFNGVLVEYAAQVVYNLKKVIVEVKPIDRKITIEKSPIYYKDEDKVIFTEDMNIAFPAQDGSQYRLYKYATYTYDNESHKISNDGKSGSYSYFFLYNGEDLFFFPDEVSLKIDDKEYAKLGKMSYVKIVGGNTLEYYDKEHDKAEFIEVEGKAITASNDNMDINLSEKYITSFGHKILLFNPQNLKGLSN